MLRAEREKLIREEAEFECPECAAHLDLRVLLVEVDRLRAELRMAEKGVWVDANEYLQLNEERRRLKIACEVFRKKAQQERDMAGPMGPFGEHWDKLAAELEAPLGDAE